SLNLKRELDGLGKISRNVFWAIGLFLPVPLLSYNILILLFVIFFCDLYLFSFFSYQFSWLNLFINLGHTFNFAVGSHTLESFHLVLCPPIFSKYISHDV
ncbi:hypothetical protein ACJX0J_017908, partial [Zea mays]